AALACAPPRRRLPARVFHLAPRELARPGALRSRMLSARPRRARRGPRMRHLRLQDPGARRGPAPALHRSAAALRALPQGATSLATGVPDRNRPRFVVGPHARPRKRVTRSVLI